MPQTLPDPHPFNPTLPQWLWNSPYQNEGDDKILFDLEVPYLSLILRKPDFCICENKTADQLCGNHTTDQRLCFCYMDSTIPLLPKSKISRL